ncbi:MAG: hypothetical protein A2W61_07020 [Deltaproteobacteria bacterium RIFCSPLOWO2_01_44_7]|nr:MAG: hypothetical protein A2712_08240 [Deltaproteobacteria bacterium RIFCSPHIGHO2_01_FULL_43_49]OGQ14673.1 MAG: hypothetical protein A3D22_08760 [Deltaproteobacteria bacterium RIFCSPHIGHO2_02_FULL_44_53]OGQ28059.1 MAG: hypothetical protein A3D98_07470 [Deltaproteobacteria bacterium RIFCSPHIGHO2_12_FULL_44_21]OGQ31271.1 MAG: hypothetical protein A2979_07520 [Deltaproteobacteria bacterium RIFCSPLOWO2_01_FULL_45_74]OGQ43263.1 MAG: hypothetical protein A3I70_01180 [Deltaproteobacteria bacterium 
MKRKFWHWAFLLALTLSPVLAEAAKTTYVYTDRRFHFVKRVEMDKEELKERQVNHPYTFTDLQLRDMLAGVKFSRQLVFKKEVQEDAVFNQANLDFLVPHLVQAFKESQPNEEIVFAFITHRSKFVVRDDQLTIVRSWVEGNQLHMEFRKLMAKVDVTNYDKLGDVNQAMNRAQGLRVALELTPGQQYGRSTDEVLLTIPSASAVASALEKPKEEKAKEEKKTAKVEKRTTVSEPVSGSAADRLKQLDQLKKQGLISKEEYQQKRQEILNQL